MTVDKIIIDRSKWGTGYLLRRDLLALGPGELDPDEGKMCCLGFLARACGATDDEIRGMPMPNRELANKYNINGVSTNLLNNHPLDIGQRIGLASDYWWDIASSINDSTLPESVKELRLTNLFREHGIELTFSGKAVHE